MWPKSGPFVGEVGVPRVYLHIIVYVESRRACLILFLLTTFDLPFYSCKRKRLQCMDHGEMWAIRISQFAQKPCISQARKFDKICRVPIRASQVSFIHKHQKKFQGGLWGVNESRLGRSVTTLLLNFDQSRYCDHCPSGSVTTTSSTSSMSYGVYPLVARVPGCGGVIVL